MKQELHEFTKEQEIDKIKAMLDKNNSLKLRSIEGYVLVKYLDCLMEELKIEGGLKNADGNSTTNTANHKK